MIAIRYPTLFDVVYVFQHLCETSRREIATAHLTVDSTFKMVKHYVTRGTASVVLLDNKLIVVAGSYPEGRNLRKTWFFMSAEAEKNGRRAMFGIKKWAEREAYLFPNDRFEAVTYLPDSARRHRFFRLLGMQKTIEGKGFTIFELSKVRIDNALQRQ